MTSLTFHEECLTAEQEALEVPCLASTPPRTSLHVWDDATQELAGRPDDLYWGSAYVKGNAPRSAGRFRFRICWVLLSVLIPTLIISLLRALCRASMYASTNRAPNVSARRLSEIENSNQEDNILSQLVEECAAMEADLGLPVQQSNPAQALDAAEQVARIAFTLYQESLAFEREIQQAQPAANPSFPPLPPPSLAKHSQHQPLTGAPHTSGLQQAAQDPHHVTSSFVASELQRGGFRSETLILTSHPGVGVSHPVLAGPWHFPADKSPSAFLSQGVFARPQPDVAASNSLGGAQPALAVPQTGALLPQAAALLPHAAAQRDSSEQSYNEGRNGGYPELDPDSWLDDLPMINILPEGQTQSQAFSLEGLSPDIVTPCSGAACLFLAGDSNVGDAVESPIVAAGGGCEAFAATAGDVASNVSTPAGTPTAPAASNQHGWLSSHPYVRLPVLQEGVVSPFIQLSASNFGSANGLSVREVLLSLRSLFAKQALNQEEAILLVGQIQGLAVASAARARVTKRMHRPEHGVMNIGQQFLVLDAIVSAVHILGVSPPSCKWWEAFIECFDTEYRYTQPGRRTKDSGVVNIALANRMLDAIAIYKTGNRPDLGEVIDVKRILFFSPCMPLGFRHPKWDPWRTDHLRFEREHPVLSEWLLWRRHSLY